MKHKSIFYFLLFLITGLAYFFSPAIHNPDLMPGDLGDARFINYILEHGYLYLKQVPIHSSFWDMPIFYPRENTLSYSDVLLGGMLIYTPIRFFFNPQTALQIWLATLCILNYVSVFLLLKNIFKFKPLACCLGAFIFAFSLPRYSQIFHFQLFCQFYTIFCFLCFFSIKKENTKLKNNLLFLTGTTLYALQLYSAFYLGWYIAYSVFLSLAICFCFKCTRDKIIDFIKTFKFEIPIYFIVFIILILPLYIHYTSVGTEFDFFEYNLKPSFFFNTESLIDIKLFNINYIKNCEENICLGFFTTLIFIIGLIKCKKERKFIAIFLSVTLLIFSTTFLREMLYNFFPGTSAIRATGRIIFLFIIFYSYVLGKFINGIKNKFLLLFIVLLIIIEQMPYENHWEWSKKEHNERLSRYNVDKKCEIVQYDIYAEPQWAFLLDIMWFSSINNIYTKNGYSGFRPMPTEYIFNNECHYTIHNFKGK